MEYKKLLTKISCITLAGTMLLTGQALAKDVETPQILLTPSAVDKVLGYSSNYSLRQYDEYRLQDAIGKKNLIQLLLLNTGTTYSSTGISISRERSLGYITSSTGIAKEDGSISTRLENYRLFPSVYKMSFPTGKIDNKDLSKPDRITIGFNDPCIYEATNEQAINMGAYKGIKTYNGGDMDLVREDIKEHVLKYGAVGAKIYRGDSYFKYRTGGKVEYHESYDEEWR